MKKVKRIGLLNFWLYDDEELEFYDGKLLLRGENGTGKSVTMQSFIPLIFDGNKSPTRLDTFGGANKHLEDYILGGFDTPAKDEATSYLYMEVYDEDTSKYITVGMGFHAKKSRPVDFWGFSILDNRRIGKDFSLYKNSTNKVPLTKKELQSLLGSNNKLVERVEDYKIMVNDLLFGFDNIESYEEFINVILQLRSPKLSKGYNPTQLMEVLEGVLKPLSDEDLRPLSIAIEEIDKMKEKKENLSKDIHSINNFLKSYKNYNEIFLYTKSSLYINKLSDKKKEDNEIKNTNLELEISLKEVEENNAKLTKLSDELEHITKLKENLKDNDIEAKVKRKEELISLIKETISRKDNKNIELNNKQLLKEKYFQNKTSLEKEMFNLKNEALDILNKVKELSDIVKYYENYSVLKDMKDNFLVNIDFNNLRLRLSKYKETLNNILDKLEEKKKISSNMNRLNEEISKLEKECLNIDIEIKKCESNLEKALINLKDSIYNLKNTNNQVILNQDDYNKIIDKLTDCSESSYNNAKDVYERISNMYEEEKHKEINNILVKIKIQSDNVSSIKNELDVLKQSNEEELPISLEIQSTINYLKEHNILNIPFYKAVEFNSDVDNITQNKLESLLLASNLLNAFIINDTDKNKVKDCYGTFIFPSIKKKDNLTKYLKASSNIDFPTNIVTKVLESISINDKDEIYINENNFKISNILNISSSSMESKYIGLLKRKNIRQKKIDSLEEKLKLSEEILNNLKNMNIKMQDELTILKEEKLSFPSNKELIVIEKEINKKQLEIDIKVESKNKKIDELDIENNNYTLLEQTLIKLKKDISLALDIDVFKNTINNIVLLDNDISLLDKIQSNYRLKKDNLNIINTNIKEMDNRYNEILIDINNLNNMINKYTIEKQSIEEILNSPKYQDIKNTLDDIVKKEKDIPITINNIERKLGILEEKINSLTKKLNEEKEKLNILNEECNKYEKCFMEEYNLNYVFNEEYNDVYKLAISVKEKLKDKENNNITNAIDNYYNSFNAYRLELNDYHLTNINIFEDSNYPRCDIRTTYQGRNLSIYELKVALNVALEENDILMSNQDEKLFHEILLKTVGNKIKNYIMESNEWVKKINKIMKDSQVGSNLSFELKWSPKDAADEDELDTKELVDYFNKSDRRSDADTDKLIKHFKNRLNRELEMNMEKKTFAEIIFDVLDYRKWYNFKMEYYRSNGSHGALTDKVFSIFSGGERAKAMYIPLLCAVSAKLDNISQSTLRLVALDEAFAGVDEVNIVEILNIINHLKLDYIFTSQSLWCDYSVIEDLSIANLIRPKGSNTVAIERYRWNGLTKEVILNKEVTNEFSQLF